MDGNRWLGPLFACLKSYWACVFQGVLCAPRTSIVNRSELFPGSWSKVPGLRFRSQHE